MPPASRKRVFNILLGVKKKATSSVPGRNDDIMDAAKRRLWAIAAGIFVVGWGAKTMTWTVRRVYKKWREPLLSKTLSRPRAQALHGHAVKRNVEVSYFIACLSTSPSRLSRTPPFLRAESRGIGQVSRRGKRKRPQVRAAAARPRASEKSCPSQKRIVRADEPCWTHERKATTSCRIYKIRSELCFGKASKTAPVCGVT